MQEGYVDMMLMPSEKKLVADEDFADAIDDEEDEDDEAVVTATANVLDNRRCALSGLAEERGEDKGWGCDRESMVGEERAGGRALELGRWRWRWRCPDRSKWRFGQWAPGRPGVTTVLAA